MGKITAEPARHKWKTVDKTVVSMKQSGYDEW